MEINKEYYAPTIEELFVGYEYEVIMEGNPKTWVKMLVDSPRLDYSLNIKKFADGSIKYSIPDCIRTKFLCKQDVVDLGFVNNKLIINDLEYLITIASNKVIEIYETDSTGYCVCRFNGYCKSKNELKKLMKDYLNIPI